VIHGQLTGRRQEGEDGVIKLEARPATTDDESDVDYLVRDDPEMVRHMVSYFYNLKYSCVNTNPTDETNGYDDSTTSNPRAEMLTHAKMFAIAVKYQIDGLRDFAAKSFRYAVHVYWDSDEFLKAVTIVLDSTPEEVLELRHTVFDTIYDHYRDLKHKDEVKDAFRDHPLFAQDLLDRKWDRYSYLEDHESAQTGTTQSECAVCHQYKEELEFVSGLPKMCSKCNSGDFSGW
jgi:hypothetical protein